jgi:hypothetical protein
MCQIYERPIAHTPMRFFPPLLKDCLVWKTCMEALQGHTLQEDDPTVVFMTIYLLALDEQYDKQSSELKKCIC